MDLILKTNISSCLGKGRKEKKRVLIFWTDGVVLYLDYGGGYMTLSSCQNCTAQRLNFAVCKIYPKNTF